MPRHRGHKVVRTVLGNVHPDSLRRSAPPHWQDAPLLPVQVVRQGALRRQGGGVERPMIYLTTGGLQKYEKGPGWAPSIQALARLPTVWRALFRSYFHP